MQGRFQQQVLNKSQYSKQNIQFKLIFIFKLMNPYVDPKPKSQVVTYTESSTSPTKFNIVFAIVVIVYEILALPIYGVLFRLAGAFTEFQDYGGVLLMSISTILLIVGFGLINAYIVRSSFTGMTFTLVIFALTIQHFFLFRAFWNKAGANDYDNSSKTWDSWYDVVSLSNYDVDRQLTALLPSGPFVQAIAMAISLTVAFNSVIGRIGLLEVFFLTFFGAFFYEVNAQLIYRWFITDIGYGCRIFLFGSIVGIVSSFLLGKKQTTLNHQSYRSEYRMMSYGLLGFLFVCVTLPILCGISIFTRSTNDNAVLYATQMNAWLAVFSSVLGTFTASAFLYRKFSVHDLVFTGSAGAISLSMEADINFNPCVPLIVGYIVGFASSIYPSVMNRRLNKDGVIYTFSHVNRFFIPGFIACVVSAIVQGVDLTINGQHNLNRLGARTAIQQGGWQIVGFLITAGTAIIAGLIIGILYKIINKNTSADQFNDETTYYNVPSPALTTD